MRTLIWNHRIKQWFDRVLICLHMLFLQKALWRNGGSFRREPYKTKTVNHSGVYTIKMRRMNSDESIWFLFFQILLLFDQRSRLLDSRPNKFDDMERVNVTVSPPAPGLLVPLPLRFQGKAVDGRRLMLMIASFPQTGKKRTRHHHHHPHHLLINGHCQQKQQRRSC